MKNKEAYYKRLLELCRSDDGKKREFIAEAYKVALDTRKFEIDMYWKRANYFWLFTAAIFIAYFAAFRENLVYVYVTLSLLGFLFSFGWYLVARGSKVWQENWEMHISYLEEEIHGPLFKTFNLPNTNFWKLTKEYPFSVSKVNQILSLFTSIFWLGIFFYSLNKLFPDRWKCKINQETLDIILFAGFTLLFIIGLGVLIIYSKSFQYKDLKKNKSEDYEKYYFDEKKEKGNFYYRKRGGQKSILGDEMKTPIFKKNWLEYIKAIFKS